MQGLPAVKKKVINTITSTAIIPALNSLQSFLRKFNWEPSKTNCNNKAMLNKTNNGNMYTLSKVTHCNFKQLGSKIRK